MFLVFSADLVENLGKIPGSEVEWLSAVFQWFILRVILAM